MRPAQDIIHDFKNGKINLGEFRQKLQEVVYEQEIFLESLQKNRAYNPEDPAQTAKNIELATFLQIATKAKSGDFGAAQKLSEWSTKASTLVGGTDNLGGYTVPDELASQIIALQEGASAVMPYLTKVTMTSDRKKIPVLDTSVSVSWHSEDDAITETNPTFAEADLVAYRQDALTKASNELLEDSTLDILSILLDQFEEQAAQHFDNTVFNGDGAAASAAFSGVFTAAVAYSAAFDTGSTAFSEILVDDLIDVVHLVPSYARAQGQIVMHSDVAKYLRKEKDSNGRYLWDPFASGPMSIYGKYPIIESHKAPSDSDSGAGTACVSFGNFKYLVLGRRKDITLLIDPYTDAANWRTRIFLVQRLALAYARTGAFSRLLTAAS